MKQMPTIWFPGTDEGQWQCLSGSRKAREALSVQLRKGVTEAAAALKALADSMARRAAQAADLGRLLDILNKIPGVDFERREPDAAYLATMMAAFQMGELSLVVTCTGPKSTDIEILRMMPLAAAEADALVGSAKFSATVRPKEDQRASRQAWQQHDCFQHGSNHLRRCRKACPRGPILSPNRSVGTKPFSLVAKSS